MYIKMLLSLFVVSMVCIALKDDIAAANEKFMTAFKAQDANAIAALYTEDCKVMPSGSDVVMGREGSYYIDNTLINFTKILYLPGSSYTFVSETFLYIQLIINLV